MELSKELIKTGATYEDEDVRVCLIEEEIVHVYFKEGLDLSVDLVERLQGIYDQVLPESKYYVFEAAPGVTMTKEARVRSRELEETAPKAARAIIVSNLAHRLIANFYYRFNKPVTPYKIFENLDAGVHWLKEIAKSNR